jgi:hypothetical protein
MRSRSILVGSIQKPIDAIAGFASRLTALKIEQSAPQRALKARLLAR